MSDRYSYPFRRVITTTWDQDAEAVTEILECGHVHVVPRDPRIPFLANRRICEQCPKKSVTSSPGASSADVA